jgi:SWIM zinc finger
MTVWSIEQVLALAPDASAAQAGRGLGSLRKWTRVALLEGAVWGECQGSGAEPYRTVIDLSGPAFRCSCPSRKFPCKHALGLFLIYAADPTTLAQVDAPAWATEWLVSRRTRAEKEQERNQRTATAIDPVSAVIDPARAAAEQQRRASRRDQRVRAGLDELERWFADVAHSGLADLAKRPTTQFDHMAARLVDAQAPGLARRMRELASLPHAGERWPERMLIEIGRCVLLLEAYRRVEDLSDDLRADVRTQVGFVDARQDILSRQAVPDSWSVLGRRVLIDDRLKVQRTWLWGTVTARWALVLDFAAGQQQSLDQSLVPGTCVHTELCFYPGAAPGRAILKGSPSITGRLSTAPTTSIERALRLYAEALGRNPWFDQYPIAVGPVVPSRTPAGSWLLVDEDGHQVGLAGNAGWHLMAMSGGHPIGVFGEWDGFALWPLAVRVEDTYEPLRATTT